MSANKACHIGYDYGTSSTKVIVRFPYEVGAPCYAIHFGENGHHSNRYLLPTRYNIENDGTVVLNPNGSIGGGKEHLFDQDAKHIVAESWGGISAELSSTVFIAAAIKLVKSIVPHTANIPKDEIQYSLLCLGMPASAYKTEIGDLYRKIGIAANRLSSEDVVNIERGRIILNEVSNFRNYDNDRVFVQPEIMAEYVGYLQSNEKKGGLRVIVDVGATTLDVCCFILIEDVIDRMSIFESSVSAHGLWRLQKARTDYLHEQVSRVSFHSDPISPIPEDFSSCFDIIREARYDDEVLQFYNNSVYAIQRVLVSFYKKTKLNPEWEKGIPLYLCGGGGNHKYYREKILRQIKTNLTTSLSNLRFQIKDIPVPLSIRPNHDIDHTTFERLSVAYGLSYDPREVGDYGIAVPINRNTNLQEDFSDRFPGKEVQ